MRRLGAVTALVAVFWSSGCGTMVNLLDFDSHGREAYGGVTRDLRFFEEHPILLPGPPHPPSGGGSSPLGLAVLLLAYPAIILAELGLMGTEVSLSWVGDTCTLPLVPALNRVDGALLRKPPAVLPEDLPGSASQWLRHPWAQAWSTEDVEPPATPAASAPSSSEQPSPPKSRKRDVLPLLLSDSEVREGMARWSDSGGLAPGEVLPPSPEVREGTGRWDGGESQPWWSKPSDKK